MNYLIKHFDDPLIEFEVIENTSTPIVKIINVNNEKRDLFPLDMEPTEEGIGKWSSKT